jgi:hypothetical protein
MNVRSKIFVMLWRILKIISISIGILVLLFVALTWIVYKKKNAWLQEQIQSYLKESQSGEVVIGNLDLKLLWNFPDVTLELINVNYFEHFDSIRTKNEKPIVSANRLYVAVELLPLLKNELNIKSIKLSDAQLNLFEYPDGSLNINKALARPIKIRAQQGVTKKSKLNQNAIRNIQSKKNVVKAPVQAQSKLKIQLNSFEIKNVQIFWKGRLKHNTDSLLIKSMDSDVKQIDNKVIAVINSLITVQNLHINSFPFPGKDLTLKANINFDTEKKLIEIKECDLIYDEIKTNIKGTYSFTADRKINMAIQSSSNDFRFLSFLIKPAVIKYNSDKLNSISFFVNAKVVGELKNQMPQVELDFGLNNLDIKLPGKSVGFNDIGFDGKYSSGKNKDLSDAQLEIKNLKGNLPGGFISGNIKINNFIDPILKYKLNARLNLKDLDEVFRIDAISNLQGQLNVIANFDGVLKQIATHSMDRRRSSIISLKDVSFILNTSKQKVRELSGKLFTSNNQTVIESFDFKYGEDDFHLNARMDNLLFLLFHNDKAFNVEGNIFSNQIFTKDLTFDSLSSAQVKDRLSDLSFDFKIAAGDSSSTGLIDFDINNLKVKLDELADIKNLHMNGKFGNTSGGFKLDLYKLNAEMPEGKFDVTGDLLIPASRRVEFNAEVKMENFPWNYIQDLINEIKTDKEPTDKKIPVDSLQLISADMDLSSKIITYPFDINKLIVRNGKASMKFSNSKIISTEKFDLEIDSLIFIHPKNSGDITGVKSSSGVINFHRLKIPEMIPFDIQMNVKGENDKLNLIFSRVANMSKSEQGQFTMDISKNDIEYKIRYDVKGADLGYFIRKFKKSKLMDGRVDYILDLSAKGSDWTKIKRSIGGTIAIKGENLTLSGVDVDDLISKFNQSQNFTLTDVGAVLIAGPVGLAVTKGQDFVSLARIKIDSTRNTKINLLYSKWRIEDRQLISEDVAIATNLNRIALNGRIDFANDSIPGITIAVVDKNGCSLMDQKLYGKMKELKTGKLNITKTIFGSVINSVNAVVGKDCVPVYTGIVKNPEYKKTKD